MKDYEIEFITTREAAELFGISDAHVRRLCIQGRIKAIKVGYTWLIKPEDAHYEKFKTGRKVTPK